MLVACPVNWDRGKAHIETSRAKPRVPSTELDHHLALGRMYIGVRPLARWGRWNWARRASCGRAVPSVLIFRARLTQHRGRVFGDRSEPPRCSRLRRRQRGTLINRLEPLQGIKFAWRRFRLHWH